MTSSKQDTKATSECKDSALDRAMEVWEQGETERVEALNRAIERRKQELADRIPTMAGSCFVDNETGRSCRVIAVAEELAQGWLALTQGSGGLTRSGPSPTGRHVVVYLYDDGPSTKILCQEISVFFGKIANGSKERFARLDKTAIDDTL